MTTFTYFAYGSNMLLEWLQHRCDSARFSGAAFVEGYVLNFSKKSVDGSGKATIAHIDDGATLYGSLFMINMDQLRCLDKAEGNGYCRNDAFIVKRVADGKELTTITYIARLGAVDMNLVPYDWYKSLILAGARQGNLPPNYINLLESLPGIPDKCLERKTRKRALKVLDKTDRTNS